MKTIELLQKLDAYDIQGGWLLTTGVFRQWFPDESESGLMASLRRHVDSGLLTSVARGLYANDRAHSKPPSPVEHLVGHLRPGYLSYLSLESRLSELGVLSQMPLDLLTVMTKGRSGLFHTPYGRVEFIHTKKQMSALSQHLTREGRSPLLRASQALALRDIRRVGRNVDLVMDSILENQKWDHSQESFSP